MTSESIQEKKPAGKDKAEMPQAPYTIEERQLGIWHIKLASDTTRVSLQKQWEDIKLALPLYWRLVTDIFNVSPSLFSIYIAYQLWNSIQDSLLIHLSNRLLRDIEIGVTRGSLDSRKIMYDLVIRVLCTMFSTVIQWYINRVLELLRTRVRRHFELLLMQAQLGLDMPTSQEAGSKQEASASTAWLALQNVLRTGTDVLRTASHIVLIAQLSRGTGGPIYTFLCISQPLYTYMIGTGFESRVVFGFVNSRPYLRMKNLETFAGGKFRQDIISGGLGSWIAKEYRESHDQLENVSEAHPSQLFQNQSFIRDLSYKMLGELPMVYYVLQAIRNPARFSIASVAILEQSSGALKRSVSNALNTSARFKRSIAAIKSIYASTSVVNTMAVGDVPYPRVDEKAGEENNGSKGMGFELRNISFSYPGTQVKTPALRDISLTIKPGQLVVIVGANGSGKSTLIRILSRLYDPSSGEVLIDGLPSSSYRIDDLHSATALLSQDNLIYPLSLRENIGLGHSESVDDQDMIREAAEKGGALEVVQRMKDGMETELEPYVETFFQGLRGNRIHPLYQEMEKLRKPVDVSGGEKQRIVAARSFMRFKSGKVKFVAVDEPTSALDAEGELRLFENLLAVREGKTMVFVTHRFGHLTQHADLILCMKEGNIVEMGSHEELIRQGGEYAKLYQIQASAFSGAVVKS